MADISLTGPITVDSLAYCETMIAQVAIAAGKVVYRNASASGQAALADADASASAEVVGVAVNTAGIGEPVIVAKSGATITQTGTTFTKAVAVYASVTAGSMADAAPASTKYSSIVGIPLSTSILKISVINSGVQVA